jgi:hypothetical protein
VSRSNLPAATKAALAQAHVTAFAVLELGFDSGTQRLAALPFDVEVEGQTYTAAQGIGTIEPIKETGAQAAGLAFTLSGVPSSAIASVLTEPLQGRGVVVKLVVVDGSTLRVDPVVWQGTLDVPTITDGGQTAQIRITAEHAMLRWQNPTGQTYTTADQAARNPADKFFDAVAQVAKDTLVWPSKEFFRQ